MELKAMMEALGPIEMERLVKRRFAEVEERLFVGTVIVQGLALPEVVVRWLGVGGCELEFTPDRVYVHPGGLRVSTKKGSRQGIVREAETLVWRPIGTRLRFEWREEYGCYEGRPLR